MMTDQELERIREIVRHLQPGTGIAARALLAEVDRLRAQWVGLKGFVSQAYAECLSGTMMSISESVHGVGDYGDILSKMDKLEADTIVDAPTPT